MAPVSKRKPPEPTVSIVEQSSVRLSVDGSGRLSRIARHTNKARKLVIRTVVEEVVAAVERLDVRGIVGDAIAHIVDRLRAPTGPREGAFVQTAKQSLVIFECDIAVLGKFRDLCRELRVPMLTFIEGELEELAIALGLEDPEPGSGGSGPHGKTFRGLLGAAQRLVNINGVIRQSSNDGQSEPPSSSLLDQLFRSSERIGSYLRNAVRRPARRCEPQPRRRRRVTDD